MMPSTSYVNYNRSLELVGIVACEPMKFRDSNSGINEFTDLHGIAKQIRKLTEAFNSRNGMNIVWFIDARGHGCGAGPQ